MEPVLYIDILFLVNWMMDAVVLILTGQLLRRRIRLWKVSLAMCHMLVCAPPLLFPGV